MVSKTYKCLTCGAELKWRPSVQCWQCEYCDTKFDESDFANHENQSNNQKHETKKDNAKGTEASSGEMVTYKCSYCSAELVTTSETSATFCVYCQRPVILENNLSGKFQPELIIPFKNTKKEALDAYQAYIKKLPFIPNDFKNKENIQKITGVYVPFWLMDMDIRFYVEGEGKIVKKWSDDEYRYTKTDTYGFVRGGKLNFSHVPADASKKIDDGIMDSIEPFDFNEMVSFKMPYLSGFLSEKYDVSLDESATRIFNRCQNTTESQVNGTINYTGVIKRSNNYEMVNSKSRYVLLPVWMLSTQYKDKSYMFAMNGQSGKILGNSPVSIGKMLKYGLLSFLGSSAIATGVYYLIWLGGSK